MHQVDFPNQVVFAGNIFNYAGRGALPGSQLYLSPATGSTLNVVGAKVVSTGNLFAVASVGGDNGSLPPVQVSNGLVNGWGPLKLGWLILVAIDFDGSGPKAKAVWPGKRSFSQPAKDFTKPLTVEKLGVISAIKPRGFGFISAADQSGDLWFHISEVRGFFAAEGLQVRYFVGTRPDGRPCAVNIRRA